MVVVVVAMLVIEVHERARVVCSSDGGSRDGYNGSGSESGGRCNDSGRGDSCR